MCAALAAARAILRPAPAHLAPAPCPPRSQWGPQGVCLGGKTYRLARVHFFPMEAEEEGEGGDEGAGEGGDGES